MAEEMGLATERWSGLDLAAARVEELVLAKAPASGLATERWSDSDSDAVTAAKSVLVRAPARAMASGKAWAPESGRASAAASERAWGRATVALKAAALNHSLVEKEHRIFLHLDEQILDLTSSFHAFIHSCIHAFIHSFIHSFDDHHVVETSDKLQSLKLTKVSVRDAAKALAKVQD